jgi:sulfur carrier protein ThiS
MEVTIVFNSQLRRYAGTENGEIKVDWPKGITVGQVIEGFKIIPGEVGLIILNSKIATQDAVLQDKDKLELYPVFGGG